MSVRWQLVCQPGGKARSAQFLRVEPLPLRQREHALVRLACGPAPWPLDVSLFLCAAERYAALQTRVEPLQLRQRGHALVWLACQSALWSQDVPQILCAAERYAALQTLLLFAADVPQTAHWGA